MKAFVLFLLCFSFVALTHAQSDPAIASVQQTLKDQGFYYGAVTGKRDPDTTAAIRRYQIRNGLQITGELNAETQKSLGIKGNFPPAARSTPAPAPRLQSTPGTSDLRDERPPQQAPPPRVDNGFRAPPPRLPSAPSPEYSDRAVELAPATSAIFGGTPYQNASPEMQRQVIASAQSLMARRGYYHGPIDGVFGPGTAFALRAFQSRFDMNPDGRLNSETLAALGLLPGQRAPGVTARTRRVYQRSSTVAPNGEPVYEPR